MKKTVLLLLCIVYSTLYVAQSQNIETTLPTPSAAGLSTFSTMPVSIQTGIPNISYPLINLESANKSVSINLGLSYHAGNTSEDKWVSEVGQGWSFLGGGIISREIEEDFDEVFDDSSVYYYTKNEFDDVYNFNTPEESGKFKIIRDIANNTFSIVKLTPYNSKVEYQRTSNQATLILNSFTITSETGIKYVFTDYDTSKMNVWIYTHPLNGHLYGERKYKSAFYLSSILDQNGQELVKYTYLRDKKYAPGTGNVIDAETLKLSRIEVIDRGIIDINYDREASYEQHNDIFSINNIVLKTVNNTFVEKYTFSYSYKSSFASSAPIRVLDSFTQVDSSGNTIEKYAFNYENLTYLDQDNHTVASNISELKSVELPTGGIIEYNFDLPLAYRSKTIIIPVPKVLLAEVSFLKVNSSRQYAFTIDQAKTLDIDASGIGQVTAFPWSIQFWKKEGSNYVASHSLGEPVEPIPGFEYVQSRTFEPGEYYLNLYCNDISCPTSQLIAPAVVQILREGDGEPTEMIVNERVIDGPPRIKNIKYYNASVSVSNSPAPAKIQQYEYNNFDDPQKSSGYTVEETIIYKNVKTSNGDNMGYTKYYFKAPDAYPKQGEFLPHYNLTREGLLDKKEIYNSLHQKLSEELFDYTIEEFDGPLYKLSTLQVKTSWIKNNKITSKNYFDSGTIETTNEVFRNTHNNKPNLERTTSFDGSIQETTYQYAFDKSNQKLLDANMTGILLETSTITKKSLSGSGQLLSRQETKYDNAGNKYPSSTVSYDSKNNIASEVVFNKYDNKGNLEQYTPKNGPSVSIVWGYNKTRPIAKVEGASYDKIAAYVSDIITKSNVATVSESDLQSALDSFRNNTNLKNYLITTYLYDSLSRIRTTTPSTGIRTVYQYDTAGRLEKVQDENGNLLKKHQYNFGH
ncbi:RHS repeat domain-containing protein [Chryseobacterium sp.]|uniref:RHS repeat domain-containing protein n=1 Tax=Chryseobacterium sp. TaxID=1871047 RepID=UPI0031E240A1